MRLEWDISMLPVYSLWYYISVLYFCHCSLGQYSYQQPFVGIPSEACVGGAINLTCETVFTNSGNLLSVAFTRNGTMVTGDTPNHTILTREGIVIGVIVSNVTLDDDDIEYTCTTSGAPDDFVSSLILNVTGAPIIGMITVTEGCSYLYVSWMYNNNACGNVMYTVTTRYTRIYTTRNSFNFTGLPYSTLFNVIIEGSNRIGSDSNSTLASTLMLERPVAPIMVETDVSIDVNTFVISVSWQAPPVTTSCTANIIMYNITVMDQYSPAIVTVPANMLSVEISQFPYNGTVVATNREYNITVSAVSELGLSDLSDSVTVNTFILQNCDATSPSIGTIRVSCDSSHQIQVTLTCTNNCNNPVVNSSGNSPLIVRGLDPGIMYSVIINVFDGNQVVLSNSKVMEAVVVMISGGVLQRCTITSPSANTIRVSCELLETFTRISVTISSNSCTCSQPITMVDNNPITVSDLPIGVYTVEVTAVNSNDMSIENNRIVQMITVSDKSTATDESDSSSLSTGAAIAIACVISVLVSITVTAIVTFAISYMLMKRKNESTPQDNINKVLYEEVTSPSHTSKNNVELQQNPAYGTGHKVVMDTNPAYESYK